MSKYAVKIIESSETSYKLGGYGVVYGGEDLTGEGFTKETDFWLDKLGSTPMVMYQHGMDGAVKHAVIGRAAVKQDDIGLWVEAQIDLANEYAAAIRELAERGVLGWSSGSVSHLVERENKVIKSWPIVEFSLTPTPAEPRTLGVKELRSLVEDAPEVEAVLPEDGGKPSAEATESEPATVKIEPEAVTQGETKMSEGFTPEQMEQIQALFTKTINELPAYQKALHVEPDGVGSTDRLNDETKSFANFLVSVQRHDTKRLERVYKAALAEGTGSTGGYTVPVQYANEILAIATENSVVRPRATIIPGVKAEFDFPALYNAGGTTGTPASLAGVVATWTAEAGTKTETEPTFDIVKLKPHELSGYSLISKKLMADNGVALEAVLKRLFGEAIGWYEDYAFLYGVGTTQPLGIFESPCLDYSNTIATDSKIVIADIAEMVGSMLPSAWAGAAWYVSTDVIPQLMQLAASSSGPLAWLPDAQADPMGSGMRLFGKPVYVTEKLNTIPDVQNEKGGLLLANMRYYLIADAVDGLAIDYSEHYKFINNQGTFRFCKWVDGQPWLANTITLANGKTCSAFVTTKGPA